MLREKRMVRAIERHFMTKYDVSRMTKPEATDLRFKRPDLLFIQARRDCLHAVEAESTLRKAFLKIHGFRQLAKYKGNYKWLALPYDEYLKDPERVKKECERRGFGLILVSGKQRLRVYEVIQPVYIQGDFLSHYPETENEWYE